MNTTSTLLRKALTVLFLVTLFVTLSGCGAGTKEQIGTVLGAGLGGLAGSFIGDGQGQLISVAVGTMVGSFLGSEIGKSPTATAPAGKTPTAATPATPCRPPPSRPRTAATAASSSRPSSSATRPRPPTAPPAGRPTARGASPARSEGAAMHTGINPIVFFYANGAGHVVRRQSGAVSLKTSDLAPAALRAELERIRLRQARRPA